ncbi:MAG: RagB/SusD family nutrient uptake outer membrane protein [Bacteroidetes bacterium]|nr:RagB/SusD family nutrient uptake outer membrane protein [Bacteroidota bacterium]
MKTGIQLYLSIFFLFAFSSCKKYLDARSDQRLATPSSLSDLQALENSVGIMNNALTVSNNSTDEYYVHDADLGNLDLTGINSYLWDPNTDDLDDWSRQYVTVYYANSILDNLALVDAGKDQARWNDIKGKALFFRSYTFFEIAQLFAKQYNSGTAASDPGIVLRLNSNFDIPSKRSSVQQSYDQILSDLHLAAKLVQRIPINKTQPGQAAVYALLSRVYLQMGDYANAKVTADSCLKIYSSLLDYNTLDTTAQNPFQEFNDEVIYYTNTYDAINTLDYMAKADSNLVNSYATNDLRKKLFYKDDQTGTGAFVFEGSYNGTGYKLFNGIATDEVYLTRAESKVRTGDIAGGIADLNLLLSTRFITGTFSDLTAGSEDSALSLILSERKKELVNRGTRWSDLRRLNDDSRFAITLTRFTNSQTYTLVPGDKRYTLLIPQSVINTSHIEQNPR